MDKPYKIIWKYKNNNRYTQYQHYIFVGSYVSRFDQIFNKIRDLDLFDTLMELNKNEIRRLEDYYGKDWYKLFFNMYHTGYILKQIQNNKSKKKSIIDKLGREWFEGHVKNKNITKRKMIYSYSYLINQEEEKKDERMNIFKLVDNDETDRDYKINKNRNINSILSRTTLNKKIDSESNSNSNIETTLSINYDDDIKINTTDTESYININGGNGNSKKSYIREKYYDWNTGEVYDLYDVKIKVVSDLLNNFSFEDLNKMKGGADLEMVDELKDELNSNDDDIDIEDLEKLYAFDEENVDNIKDINNQLNFEVSQDLEEIEKIYQQEDVDIDKDSNKTSNMIEKALKDTKIFKKQERKFIDFDSSKDDNDINEKLRNIYSKIFVKTQFIYSDDSIKTVKEKICCSIRNNNKFGEKNYLLPSRQYFWSEYIYNDIVEKVMVGQKWLRRTELLDIDVEPDNRLHVYESLKDQLDLLRLNLKRFGGSKIRREDDDNNILRDYENYITDNEIHMIDIYNELGLRYSPSTEKINNLIDVYMKIYFHNIRSEDFRSIISYLNGDVESEEKKMEDVYTTINNDLTMKNEIMNIVDTVKKKEKYDKLFKENYVTQSTIHVNLRLINIEKYDLYRIFDDFETTEEFPHVVLNTLDRDKMTKSNEDVLHRLASDKNNHIMLTKWFQMSPFGISFKVKIYDEKSDKKTKYMNINLSESGRIEYKTQWQESDGAVINDVLDTHKYIRGLVEKINRESAKNRAHIPIEEEFKYAFINTIQKFEFPGKHVIDHNDFSEFARFFYPYVALVIEPRKRLAKDPKSNSSSKYGTYLRYKRVSKYENQARLEQRIIFFIRNYDFKDHQLTIELAKQFNITEDKAMETLNKVREKYPTIKKTRKVLKKLESMPKYKPAGISIDIQGKQRDNYKIRVAGARDDVQLDKIIEFMNILIYLYVEIYLLKRKDKIQIKNKLKSLSNIAKRRAKVEEIVDYTKDVSDVKVMTKKDKQRLGYKPEDGENQWTRACQNSGKDKKRRPQQYSPSDLDQLVKLGYKFNKKTELFERKFKVNRKTEALLRTVRLPELNDQGDNTGRYIHYACDPKENGKHMYVGFLTRSKNPYGHCMPCCFKKDPSISDNKVKREFYFKCLGLENEMKKNKNEDSDENENQSKVANDKLYILQDTNKIQEGRFGFLPKYLDRYMNFMLGNEKLIKNHYLEISETGYYFKMGINQEDYAFLNAISTCLNIDIQKIKERLVEKLQLDKSDQIFTSMNNGDVKTQFETRQNLIKYIEESPFLNFELIKDMIIIPDVLIKSGINLIIFRKKEIIIKKALEKQKIIEDFYIDCVDFDSYYNIDNENYANIFLIKDGFKYYPIVKVTKTTKSLKNIDIQKVFFTNDENSLVDHVSEFYKKNCSGNFLNKIKKKYFISAKRTSYLLRNINEIPRYQIVDVRNKCIFIITSNGDIIPVSPSGCAYDIQIIKSFDNYVKDFDTTMKYLKKIYKKSEQQIPIKPIGLYYDMDDRLNSRLERSKKKLKINAIMTKGKNVVPIKMKIMTIKEIEKLGLIYERKPLDDRIDKEIKKGSDNKVIDERIISTKQKIYDDEAYQLFRLEFSSYINDEQNIYQRMRILKVMKDKKISKLEKIDKIRLILYRILDKDLYSKYIELIKDLRKINSSRIISDMKYLETIDDDVVQFMERMKIEEESRLLTNQVGGKINKLIYKVSNIPNIVNYELKNNRNICKVHDNKEECNRDPHCRYAYGSCYLTLTTEMIVMFVNRSSDELANYGMKAKELLREDNYFVSDIVNRNNFTFKTGQVIIKENTANIRRKLKELFGRDNIPKIGKRNFDMNTGNYEELNIRNPMIDLKEIFVQRIIQNNITLFRAYANGYYWIKNSFYDVDSRNLGFYNPLQTEIGNKLKSIIIEWLSDPNNKNNITKLMKDSMGVKLGAKDPVKEYIKRLAHDEKNITNGITEFLILTKVIDYPVIIRNDIDDVLMIFNKGVLYDKPNRDIVKKYDLKQSITLRYQYIGSTSIPDRIEILYYK
jgi:hypothetical protein